MAASGFFTIKRDTLSLLCFYLLPVTTYRFIGILLPDGASIQDQLWHLSYLIPGPLQWGCLISYLALARMPNLIAVGPYIVIAQIKAVLYLHWPWNQSDFFLGQAFHSHSSYLLRVVGIGKQKQTETHKYSFGR